VYWVSYADDAPLDNLVWATLVRASEAMGRAVWITAADPDPVFAAGGPLQQRLAAAVDSGNIRTFTAGTPEGISRVLEELDYFAGMDDQLILIEQADRFLFASQSPGIDAVLRQLCQWARQHRCAVLLQVPAGSVQPVAVPVLSGVARLDVQSRSPHWTVDYWFADAAVVAHQAYRLGIRKDGWLCMEEALSLVEAGEQSGILDEGRVVVSRAALTGHAAPAGWEVLESNDLFSARLSGLVAATLLLHFDSTLSMESLAHTVFTLRQMFGARVKIVVREVNAHLRYNQEHLLFQAGANLVIPAEVNFTRVLGLLDALMGQVYVRVLPADFDVFLGQVRQPRTHGFQPLPEFVATVRQAIGHGHHLSVAHALVRLLPPPGLKPLEVLASLETQRMGDLYTADDESIYVFFYSCREEHVDLAMDRLFRIPVSELSEGEVRFLSLETIAQAIDALSRRQVESERATEKVSEPVQKTSANRMSPAPQRPPVPARRRPLPLRAARKEALP
jgi:cellulose biosynthesis protein BcsE